MGKYRALLLGLLFSSTLLVADMYWADDYKSGLKEAAEQNKKILILFSEEDQPASDDALWTISFDKNVSNYVSAHFIAIEIDVGYDSRQGFKVYKTPTIYFLDSHAKQIGKPLTKQLGPIKFLQKLKEIEAK